MVHNFASFMRRREVLLASLAFPILQACSKSDGRMKRAGARSEFSIGWSNYASWALLEFAERTGIVKKWADRYALRIDIVQIGDYVGSLGQFLDGNIDGVTATLGDGFSIPAAGGRDTTVLLLCDYSNGNDAILSKTARSIADLKGRTIHLEKGSVSQYLLARALNLHGLSQADVHQVNVSNTDIVELYNGSQVETVVAWNPDLELMRMNSGGQMLFDSSQIPGEIVDAMMIDTEVLNATPDLGKALVGIWFETIGLVLQRGNAGENARAMIAELSGITPETYDALLRRTAFFRTPQVVEKGMTSAQAIANFDMRRRIRFQEGMLKNLTSPDQIGIQFETAVLGDARNIKLRIDPRWVRLAAEGRL